MKKAFIDQIMLGFFLFSTLIVVGTTISDNMQARNKYYQLKKITDNAVLTLAKYYITIEDNTANAETIYNAMLDETKLGTEIKNSINYTWDLISEPNTVTATIPTYNEETFWFKFLGISAFNLKAESRAIVTSVESNTPTSPISTGFAPFAINDRAFTIGDTIDLNYSLTANWQYSDKDTFYPVVVDCDCDCNFILSNQFDFSQLGFDIDNCDNSSSGCTTHGESEFVHYSQIIDDIYNANYSLNFTDGKADTPICLLGTYLGNSTSSWATQINHLSSGIYEIIGSGGENLPLEMDFITLGNDALANGIVRVKINSFDFRTNGNPNGRYITLNTEIVSTKENEIKLVY